MYGEMYGAHFLIIDSYGFVMPGFPNSYGNSWTDKLMEIIEDLEAFLESLGESSEGAAQKVAIPKLKPVLEPQLLIVGLRWQDIQALLHDATTEKIKLRTINLGQPLVSVGDHLLPLAKKLLLIILQEHGLKDHWRDMGWSGTTFSTR